VAGYEVWALLQELEPGALHERGFHPTAIWGTLSAAAACARLNRLNADETTECDRDRGLARGRTVANFGTMTKSLHAGRTAQSGVLAARLAKAGFDAVARMCSSTAPASCNAHSDSGTARGDARATGASGSRGGWKRWGSTSSAIRCAYATHRSIDACSISRPSTISIRRRSTRSMCASATRRT
jgi:hypothetical protein